MTRRYSSKGAAVAIAGTDFNHGLAATPDEWSFNPAAAPPATGTYIYKVAVTSTKITLAAVSGATTADVFAAVNHSIPK